jgi:CopG-like RHH_1 or ribbon-helix-helix domain, RHH_5
MSARKYQGHRVSIVIPKDVYEKIVIQATAENRPIANLCTAVLIEAFADKPKPESVS